MDKIKASLLYVMFLIILSSFVLADMQSLGTFKKDECVNLIQICDNCTFVNFTSVIYPNGVFELLNLNSTASGTVFNSSFCNTSQVGTYIISSVGDLNNILTTGSYNFYINPSGITGTDNPIGIIVPIFSLLINTFIIFLSFKKNILKNELSNFILKRSLLVFGIWLMVLNSGIMAGIAQYAGLDLTREMFLFMEIFGWGAYISMIVLVFSSIVQFMKAWKIKKQEKRMGGNYGQ